MQNSLICVFVYKPFLDNTIKNIKDNYKLPRKRIFIFENVKKKDEIFCTFNVEGRVSLNKNMIPIHRKSETNTLYTINAMNEIIKKMNNNIISEDVQVPWKNYENKILLTDQDNNLREVDVTLQKVYKI